MLLEISSLLFFFCTTSANSNAIQRLKDDLFHDDMYDHDVIPMLKPSDGDDVNAVNVQFGLDILGMDLSESGVLTANSWMRMKWNDFRLSWDPAQYEGLKKINVPSRLVWVPDFEVYNAPDFGLNSFSFQYSQSPINVVLYSNGDIIFIPPVTIRSYCELPSSIGQPTDCSIKIGSWTYDGFSIKLVAYEDKPYITLNEASTYGTKSRMVLISQKGDAIQKKMYDCCVEPYYSMDYQFKVQTAYIKGNGTWIENPSLPMALGKLQAKFAAGDSFIEI